MKKILFLTALAIPLNILAFNIKIITRSERWADESLKYASRPEYKRLLEEQEKYLENLKKHYEEYQKYLQKQNIAYLRNKYLQQNWLSEIKIDKVIEYENWNKLWWPFQYHYNKDRIVIHHTANDYKKFKNPEEIKKFLRWIYRQHAITNWWWDLGYHYIIDPWWNIYEGRAWWTWVVWAHAIWNNTPSIGIALIWNFEIQKPTKAQLISLIKLILYLSKIYNIDLSKKVYWHKPISQPPYLKDLYLPNVIWHKDVGYTACPWKNLYSLLPKIRQISKTLQNKLKSSNQKQIVLTSASGSTNTKTTKTISVETNKTEKQTVLVPDLKIIPFECKNLDQNIQIISCLKKTNWVQINFKLLNTNATWATVEILDRQRRKYIVKLFFSKDKTASQNNTDSAVKTTKKTTKSLKEKYQALLQKLREKYFATHNVSLANYKTKKIQYKISPSEASKLLSWDISVLLYELSTNFNSRDISCENSCNVLLDWKKLQTSSIKIFKNGLNLLTQINWQNYFANQIEIQDSSSWTVIFQNYSRKSYAWVPWNSFAGKIIIKQDLYKDLQKNVKKDFVVINQLKFKDYLAWIAESNDNQPFEKSKVLALIAKTYALFYMKNQHPNIPSGASYQAVDDARIFQKYVGAWFKKTSKTWPKALEQTWNWLAIYNGYVPILPYFNCSAWFTFSAEEKFGWTDTPYLQSKLDFYRCKDFNWHWVWLSWKWAEILAQKGIDWKKILKYYYDGIKLIQL